jgi:DNA-directed RNA polymerase specialized sigma24 family protein
VKAGGHLRPDGSGDDRAHHVERTPSFETFYLVEFARVERFAAGLVGENEALDLAQESFVRTWLHWSTASRSDHPVRYTIKIACNLARSAARRRATWERVKHLLAVDTPLQEPPPVASISAGLSRLSLRQRQAVLLCDYLGLTSEEAGRLLAISPSTVRVHASRARAFLRQRDWNSIVVDTPSGGKSD